MSPFHIHGCSVYSISQVVSQPYPKLYPDYASIVYNWIPPTKCWFDTHFLGKKTCCIRKLYVCFWLPNANVYIPILAGKMRSIDGSTSIFTRHPFTSLSTRPSTFLNIHIIPSVLTKKMVFYYNSGQIIIFH